MKDKIIKYFENEGFYRYDHEKRIWRFIAEDESELERQLLLEDIQNEIKNYCSEVEREIEDYGK